MSDIKTKILNCVSDLVGNFVHYDRKEDEELSKEQLMEAVELGEISLDDIVDKFREELKDCFETNK